MARALLKRPKVLIFDEATSYLDGVTTEQFAKTVNALKGKVSIMFITHHVPEKLRVDERVMIGLRASPPAGSLSADHKVRDRQWSLSRGAFPF